MKPWGWLLLSLFVGGTMWLYMVRVLAPWEYQMNVGSGKAKAQLGDLYSPWTATRDLLLHGQNPYGQEVTREIQVAFYGHPIIQDYGKPGFIPVDEQRFAYPVFVVFLLSPTIYAPFQYVRVGGEFVLALLTAAGTFLWLDFMPWQLEKAPTLALILLVLASPQVVQGLRFQQLALFVGFLLAAGAWCVSKNHLACAGGLLAISTIKPQMVLLALLWFLIWASSDFRRRWRLLAGLAGMLVALAGGGEVLLPGWIGYFLQGLSEYRKYLERRSFLELALGQIAGDILAGLMVCALLLVAWQNRQHPGNSGRFGVILAAFLLATTVAMPLPHPFNQVMLILPTLLFLRDWSKLPHWAHVTFSSCIAWPWVAAAVGLLFSEHLHAPSRLALLPSFATPLFPFVLAVLLAARQRSLRKAAPALAP